MSINIIEKRGLSPFILFKSVKEENEKHKKEKGLIHLYP